MLPLTDNFLETIFDMFLDIFKPNGIKLFVQVEKISACLFQVIDNYVDNLSSRPPISGELDNWILGKSSQWKTIANRAVAVIKTAAAVL